MLAAPIRPFRFYAPIREGENKLEMRFAVTGGCAFAVGTVRVGKQVMPGIERSLFSGKLRLIVEAEENCTLTAQSEEGLYRAELCLE